MKLLNWFKQQIRIVQEQHITRGMMRFFDWRLFLIVLLISLFGIVCVFSATSSEVTEYPSSAMQMLETQSTYYPQLQFRWFVFGVMLLFVMLIPPYELYHNLSNVIYVFNIGVLIITLVAAESGRGNMTAFLKVGSLDRGFQSSELGKIAMIICFSRVFSDLKKPIDKLRDLLIMGVYVAIPMVLIALQPDFGTAMVYAFVFLAMILISGTDSKMLMRILLVLIVIAVPVWYYLQNSANSDFRTTRILMWLHPEDYPDDARQIINGQIAVGSGGLFGKGIISPGSFASLGYISDDHTDFIFAVVCESFGLAGGTALIIAYILLIARLIRRTLETTDAYGAYMLVGVTAMLLAHILENLSMVLGLMPVTGIPLPFMSYGGSNMLTNMAAIGLAENVIIRTRYKKQSRRITSTHTQPI